MNICSMVGRIDGDPVSGQTGSNKTWLRFRIHVKHGQHPYEREGWFTVKAFGARADKIDPIAAGSLVSVHGALETSKDDQGRLWTALVADAVYVLAGTQQPKTQTSSPAPPETQRAMAKAMRTPPAEAFGGGFDDGFSDTEIPF